MDKFNKLCEKILQGYRPNLDEFILEFVDIFPLLKELKNTPQDPGWHAEGDVHIHTEMVLTELYKLIDIEGTHLSSEEILTLILAAVFHDIAKPITTREMEIRGIMRIAAPAHEYKGGSYIAYGLAELNLPFKIIYEVVNLVINHITPKLLVVKNLPPKDYRKLANITNVELLYLLEKADMLGRTCKDQNEQIASIDLFKMFCIEYKIWPNQDPYQDFREIVNQTLTSYSDTAKSFVTSTIIQELESAIINHPLEGIARSFVYRDSFAELIILCGPSGGGKSTWVKNNLHDYEVVSLDQLRAEIAGKQSDQSFNGQVLQAAKKLLKQHLAAKKKVVWDATNLRKDFRKQIADLGYAYNAYVTLVVFYAAKEHFYHGNKERDTQIASSILDKQFRNLEWPETSEAHAYVVVNELGEVIYSR